MIFDMRGQDQKIGFYWPGGYGAKSICAIDYQYLE